MPRDRRGQLDALLDVELVLPGRAEASTAVDRAPARPATYPPMVPALAAGDRLGKFLLERQLGAGGMGVVWQARDVELDRAVALKVLSSSLSGNTTASVRMVREARAMARLRHPNVINVFDAITIDDRDVIAMELIEGETLASWMSRRHTREAIVEAVIGAGRGLAAAHTAGMVHRDFKPHNVLVDRSGRVVVTDFGLARAIGEAPEPPTTSEPPSPSDRHSMGALDSPLTATGTVLGTPAYMAPEQLAGAPANARADQFAFCATAWEALAGQRPFPGDTVPEILDAFAVGQPRGGDGVPRRLRPVLERGLAVDPDTRWPSIDALLDALLRALHRPRRIALAVSVAVGVLAAAAITFVAVRHRSSPPPWQPTIVDLPAFEENSDGVAFSPDHTMIAFASDREQPDMFRIYVQPLAGGNARAITPAGANFSGVRWRRNGEALLAARQNPNGGYHIFQLALDGSPAIDLGPGAYADDCGDAIAIGDDDAKEGRLMLRHADGNRDMLYRTSSEFVLTPRCDPTGQRIVYTRGNTATTDHPVDNLYVIDRAKHEVPITHGNHSGAGTFTPDGQSIVFDALTKSGSVALFEIAVTGGTPHLLTTDNGPNVAPDVASDGKTIVFDRDETSRVPVVGGDGALRKLPAQRGSLLGMVVAADGEQVIAERLSNADAVLVAISTRDGSERTLVNGAFPFVSRDGHSVYYRPYRGAPVLAMIPIEGGTPEVIVALPGEPIFGVDGPDGQHLELRIGDRYEAWHVNTDRVLARENGDGLVFPAPSGGWRVVRSFADGHWRFIAPDGTPGREVVAHNDRPTWLDDHRFGYVGDDGFQIIDVRTGATVGTVPGVAPSDKAILGADGVHWYDMQTVGHVTHHLLVNFGDRPWRD